MDVHRFAPKVQLLCATIPCSTKAFGELFFGLVSAYSGSRHKFGFETEAPNLTKKKQIQQPLLTPKIQPGATHSPVRFSALEICQQGLGQTHH